MKEGVKLHVVCIFMSTYINTYICIYMRAYVQIHKHMHTIRILNILQVIKIEYHLMCLMAQTVVTRV